MKGTLTENHLKPLFGFDLKYAHLATLKLKTELITITISISITTTIPSIVVRENGPSGFDVLLVSSARGNPAVVFTW